MTFVGKACRSISARRAAADHEDEARSGLYTSVRSVQPSSNPLLHTLTIENMVMQLSGEPGAENDRLLYILYSDRQVHRVS